MKHMNIMGCTVTVTGLHEAKLAKLIRKLEPKKPKTYEVVWQPFSRPDVRKVLRLEAKNPKQAVATAYFIITASEMNVDAAGKPVAVLKSAITAETVE